jgi:hypothetical protein
LCDHRSAALERLNALGAERICDELKQQNFCHARMHSRVSVRHLEPQGEERG